MQGKATSNAPGPRILIADDDQWKIDLLRPVLERSGCCIETAGDGNEALLKLRAQRFDGLLLDVMMPWRDGFEVLQSLQKQPPPERPRILMLAAPTAEVRCCELMREHLIRLGADEVAFWGGRTKPKDIADTLLRLLGT